MAQFRREQRDYDLLGQFDPAMRSNMVPSSLPKTEIEQFRRALMKADAGYGFARPSIEQCERVIREVNTLLTALDEADSFFTGSENDGCPTHRIIREAIAQARD